MPTLDLSKRSPEGNGPVTEYFENKPWRRTYFVLKRQTGEEMTYDFDGDGKPEYAPFLWNGTHNSNRFPPVVGGDGALYQAAGHRGTPWIARNSVLGWKLDSPIVSVTYDGAHDEPMELAAGGNMIYYFRCEGRDGTMGAFEIAPCPGAKFPAEIRGDNAELERMVQHWSYYWYIDTILPDVFAWTMSKPTAMYGMTAYCNPPVPYEGRVYYQRWNHVFCFSTAGGKRRCEPAKVVKAESTCVPLARDVVKARLAEEIGKMLAAGHLRPGWHNWGLMDGSQYRWTDNWGDHFHEPGQTIQTLLRALPHLPPPFEEQTRAYIKREFEAYPPYQYAHIGWKDGAAREVSDLLPEALPKLAAFGPQTTSDPGRGLTRWTFPPQVNYALYQYARVFGTPELAAKTRPIKEIPPDDFLVLFPHTHNAYIAELVGLVKLAELAGQPDLQKQARADLDRLLALRVSTFSKDPPLPEQRGPVYRVVPAPLKAKQARDAEALNRYGVRGADHLNTALTVSRNFMFLTPELAERLREQSLDKVREACEEYEQVMPYWFVAKAEEGHGENTFNALFDYHVLFQAKAMILKEPYEELVKRLDVPAFWRGDLYHIDNLCAALEARAGK
jgi:hypothetical protein